MSTPDDRDTAFIGKITASATHELRNVLAIIKESAGLIEDIVESSDKSGPHADRLMRAVGRIREQIKRGADLITSLNAFAHSLDHDEEKIELNQTVQQVSFLCQRGARQRRQFVEGQPIDQDSAVFLSKLWLQMAICAAVECCLEQLPEGARVTVQPGRGDAPSLEFMAEVGSEAVPLAPTDDAAWARLAEVLDKLEASVEKSDTAQGFRLVLPG
jgi:hypothetical protein